MDGADSTTVGQTTSFRKRPLESSDPLPLDVKSSSLDRSCGSMKADSMEPSQELNPGSNTVQDEIDLHFQRSLSGPKSKRQSLTEKEAVRLAQKEPCQISPVEEHKQSAILNSSALRESSVRTPPSAVPPLLAVGSELEENTDVEDVANKQWRTGHPVKQPISTDRAVTLVTSPGLVSQQSLPLIGKPSLSANEVVPSRILNPHFITHAHSSTTCNVSRPTATQSGSVQVIDLTRENIRTSKNGIAAASHTQTRPLSKIVTSLSTKDERTESVGKVAVNSEVCKEVAAHVITRNGTATASSKVVTPVSNPVIFLPAAPGGMGSAVVMQPQPLILMNPAEMPRVSPPPLIAAHNVYAGGGSSGGTGNYVLLSPGQTMPNPLFQVISSANASPSGIPTLAGVPASQILLVGTPSTKTVTSTSVVSGKEKKDDINVMPASVEDHFAKALGDQWPQLNSDNVSHSSHTVKS